MIRLIGTHFLCVIFAINSIINDCNSQQPIVKPVLHLQESDIFINESPFSYRPYESLDPRYLIMAASHVRPGAIYRVIANLVYSPFPFTITATVQCNDEEIAGTTEYAIPGQSQTLLMKIPFTARDGNYQLKVEGNPNEANGGNGFVRNTTLKFLPEFLTILIQTNQLVYNRGQSISIRVILLNMEMKAYTDAIDIFLLDSRGLIMKRWNSVYPFQGFVSVQFRLPGDYPRGRWTVRVKALQQIEEKTIFLERWFTDRFDVSVSLPAFISQNEDFLEGTITANHTNLLPVNGNATIRVILKPQKLEIDWKQLNGDFTNYSSFHEYDLFQYVLKMEVVKRFEGSYSFRYDMKELTALSLSTPFLGREIIVHVEVGERFFDHIISGYARTRIINSTIILRFLDPQPAIFKPGMPFETHLAVSYSDSVPLPSGLLSMASLYVSPSFVINRENRLNRIEDFDSNDNSNSFKLDLNENGFAKLKFKTPQKIERFTLRARFTTDNDEANAQLSATSAHTSSNRMIYITTSTELGEAGHYGIFHVYANFYMKFFNYLVVSKGNILLTGQEMVSGMIRSITTFSVSLSSEMAPSCKVIVYHISQDEELVADSVSLPIKGINRAKLSLRVNLNQDRSGNLIELVPALTKSSIVGHSVFDSDFEDIQAFNDITPAKAEIALRKFETTKSKKAIWKTRQGTNEKAFYYVTHNNAIDSGSTFALNGVIVFTNLKMSMISNKCNPTLYYNETLETLKNRDQQTLRHISEPPKPTFLLLPCFMEDKCYELHQRCDGFKHCKEGTDESDCEEDEHEDQNLSDFFVYRRNRNNYFYLGTGDNFAWTDTFTSYNVDNYVAINVPQRPVKWRFNAIGMSQELGFSVLDELLEYDSARPFFITVEAPSSAVLGEQIGIRVAAFNYQSFEVRADIILEDSLDYRFVSVGPMGRVSSYMPKTSSGTHQHLIYIKPHSSFLVPIPVVPTTKGKIKIIIIGRCQVAKDRKEIEMEVSADGSEVSLHTSLMLDLRAQAYIVKFLDINITDDPIIPYQDIVRRYVFGSPEASVSIIGDVVGTPAKVKPTIDFTNLGIKYTAKSGELRMFNFAYHLYTLIYLRLTNQLETNVNQELAKQLLDSLSSDYVHQLTFFKNDSFTMFERESSVWLTAYCARVYSDAQYDDWHNYIFIDPIIIEKSVEFVLNHQILDHSELDGSFYEPTPFRNWSSPRETPVALTAHVLISLVKVSDVSRNIGVRISNAKQSAIAFLERKLQNLRSPYEVAITTYALMEAGSVDAKFGFNLLESMKRVSEGMIYWSFSEIKPPGLLYQSQRPFIQPRIPQLHESLAVEGTSYALMIYTRYGGLIQDNIVKWLNVMRLHDEGFISTFDTIIAIQALTDFSFRTHVRSITNIHLDLEVSSNPGLVTKFDLTPDNLSQQHVLHIEPNVWGHVTLTAKGAGLALVQLNTQYNVDHDFLLLQPPVQAFDIDINFSMSGRNKSRLSIRSCAKWLLTKERNTSGVAVMELTIPTGYWQNKAVIDRYLESRVVPRLSQAKVMPRSATFIFDYLDNNWSCVDFSVDRWFPVANLTRWLKAKVYDLYEPELFKEKIVDDFALYALHICEVCGSYQCPYCPFFSHAYLITPHYYFLIFLFALINAI